MEDEHRYFPAPTQDCGLSSSNNAHRYHPVLSGTGQSRFLTPSSISRGKQKFINTQSFRTLTTNLCISSDQPSLAVFADDNKAGCYNVCSAINSSHSMLPDGEYFEGSGSYSQPVFTSPAYDSPTSLMSPPALEASSSSDIVPALRIHPEPGYEPADTYHQMGSLSREISHSFDKADGLSFCFGNAMLKHGDAASRIVNNFPHMPALESKNSPTSTARCSSRDNDLLTSYDKHIMPTALNLNSDLTERCHLNSHQVPGYQTSFNQDLNAPDTDILTEASSIQEPMISDNDFSLESLGDSDGNAAQQSRQFLSPTKTPPAFRRQLSKRKSDSVFEPLLSASILEGRDNDEDESEDDDDFYSVGSRRSDPCTPTTPKTRRLENYDPYQIFQVQHSPCLILTVRVLRGRNITLGFQDYYDTPDPYITLILRSSPEGKKITSVKENNINPVWNETFTFYLDFKQTNILEINLMESNSVWFDQKVGTEKYDIANIREMDRPQIETFVFNQVSQVDIEFKLEFDRNPTLRYSLCLSSQEKEFIEQRKEKMLEGFRRLLGDDECPLNTDEVPTIAVIGSGGGFRAMTGYSGVFKALAENGVLDCSMYACGLSGSSWLLSTLYSHPKWPNLGMDEFVDELKHSVDESLLRFLNVATMFKYAKLIIQKRKEGQPVSFTDIFGRMVGETLLKGRMESTLCDQREKIKDGDVPMPLYTCVHVKKDVPARSFQEWVEFSPYEIGMPKYGTFMDSELFGSKFFMGKLVKQYKEQPLHFLQGIWGSAFCILFRRLLEDNRRIDPVEMVRQEMGKELDEIRHESTSDCSDEDVEDSSDTDDDAEDTFLEVTPEVDQSFDTDAVSQNLELADVKQNAISKEAENDEPAGMKIWSDIHMYSEGGTDLTNEDQNIDIDSAYEGEEEDIDADEEEITKINTKGILKQDYKGAHQVKQSSKDSASPENDNIQVQTEILQPLASPAGKLHQNNEFIAKELIQPSAHKKSVNWGACPNLGKKNGRGDYKQRRQAYISGTSVRKSKCGSKSYWNQLLKSVVESDSWELLSTRRGRAAIIHNFMRGLSLEQTYPLSPFTPIEKRVKAGDEFDGIFEMHSTSVKHIYMVDAGLTFNSPYPLVLRPQREVDMILSFDFSARDSDKSQPFKELLLAEKWARLNRLPFPPIDTSVFEREGMKELYIFRHPSDPHCPVVFHFVLINDKFRYYKKPGIPRETKEEFEFAEFDVFDDPKAPFSTFNFTYEHKNFERMSQLMEFNTLLHIDDIKEVMKEVIKKKREGPPRLPIQSKDIKLLRMKSVQEMRKLRRYINRMESRGSIFASTSPSTPFFTPAPNLNTSSNPFFSEFQCEASVSPGADNNAFSTLGDSFSRSPRVKKHIHPIDTFRESEEINYSQSTEEDETRKSSHFSSSLSDENICDAPSDSLDYHPVGETSSPFKPDSRSNPVQVFETCDVLDGCASHIQSPESESPQKNTMYPTKPYIVDVPGSVCTGPLSRIRANGSVVQNTNEIPLSSQKVQLSSASRLKKQLNKNPSTESLGFESNGLEMSFDGAGRGIANIPPETGTASAVNSMLQSSRTDSSSEIMTVVKQKDLPPNPFFINAFRRRSAHQCCLNPPLLTEVKSGGDKTVRSEKGPLCHFSPQTPNSSNYSDDTGSPKLLGRLNSRSPRLSPLLVSSSNKQPSLCEVKPVKSPTTPDFTLAPEAFKADGTPVFDSQDAKMYYESAKCKRTVFRRQSTVSSLENISLEEDDEPSCEKYEGDQSYDNSLI